MRFLILSFLFLFANSNAFASEASLFSDDLASVQRYIAESGIKDIDQAVDLTAINPVERTRPGFTVIASALAYHLSMRHVDIVRALLEAGARFDESMTPGIVELLGSEFLNSLPRRTRANPLGQESYDDERFEAEAYVSLLVFLYALATYSV